MTLPPLYLAFLDHLIAVATPEAILAFTASPQAQAEVRDLLERRGAGPLSVEEEAQVQQMVQFERLMSLLKARALHAMQNRDRPQEPHTEDHP